MIYSHFQSIFDYRYIVSFNWKCPSKLSINPNHTILIFVFANCTRNTLQLYFGLLVFVGYMVFDTQYIIEMAHLGDLDFVGHALRLYTDFIAVFIRILVIMVSRTSLKFLIYVYLNVNVMKIFVFQKRMRMLAWMTFESQVDKAISYLLLMKSIFGLCFVCNMSNG